MLDEYLTNKSNLEEAIRRRSGFDRYTGLVGCKRQLINEQMNKWINNQQLTINNNQLQV